VGRCTHSASGVGAGCRQDTSGHACADDVCLIHTLFTYIHIQGLSDHEEGGGGGVEKKALCGGRAVSGLEVVGSGSENCRFRLQNVFSFTGLFCKRDL